MQEKLDKNLSSNSGLIQDGTVSYGFRCKKNQTENYNIDFLETLSTFETIVLMTKTFCEPTTPSSTTNN